MRRLKAASMLLASELNAGIGWLLLHRFMTRTGISKQILDGGIMGQSWVPTNVSCYVSSLLMKQNIYGYQILILTRKPLRVRW